MSGDGKVHTGLTAEGGYSNVRSGYRSNGSSLPKEVAIPILVCHPTNPNFWGFVDSVGRFVATMKDAKTIRSDAQRLIFDCKTGELHLEQILVDETGEPNTLRRSLNVYLQGQLETATGNYFYERIILIEKPEISA